MKKRISIIVFIAVIALTIIVLIDNSHRVDFEDEAMAEMIVKTVGVEKADKLRADDFRKNRNIEYWLYRLL